MDVDAEVDALCQHCKRLGRPDATGTIVVRHARARARAWRETSNPSWISPTNRDVLST